MIKYEKKIRLFVGLATMLIISAAFGYLVVTYEGALSNTPVGELKVLRAQAFAVAIATCFGVQFVCFAAMRLAIRSSR